MPEYELHLLQNSGQGSLKKKKGPPAVQKRGDV